MVGPDDPVQAPDHACGLCVHIPFCEAKCACCHFYSVPVEQLDTEPLLSRIVRELRVRLDDNPRKVSTIFCGGGTPTILPAEELISLFGELSRVGPADRIVEFTVEVNPGTIDDYKASLPADGGVTGNTKPATSRSRAASAGTI